MKKKITYFIAFVIIGLFIACGDESELILDDEQSILTSNYLLAGGNYYKLDNGSVWTGIVGDGPNYGFFVCLHSSSVSWDKQDNDVDNFSGVGSLFTINIENTNEIGVGSYTINASEDSEDIFAAWDFNFANASGYNHISELGDNIEKITSGTLEIISLSNPLKIRFSNANFEIVYEGDNLNVISSDDEQDETGDEEPTSYPLEEGIWKAYKVIKHTEYNESDIIYSYIDPDYYAIHTDISTKLSDANNVFTLNSEKFNFPLLVRNEISNDATITNPYINGTDPAYIAYWFDKTFWNDFNALDKFRGYCCRAGFYCFFIGEEGEEPIDESDVYTYVSPGITMETYQVIEQPEHIIYLEGSLQNTLYEIYVNRSGGAE
jgi:hypothetical protein